jgi:DNA topoisomerase I
MPAKSSKKEYAPLLAEGLIRSADEAGLRYVSDWKRGITRKRNGKGFSYLNADGTAVRDAETLARIRSLAIPPAWQNVWISPSAEGHIQATGYDARRRRQYRYHPRWREVRDQEKYGRVIAFAQALPGIRRRVDRHLKCTGLPREKVLAAVVRLLEATLIRVGNDEYAKNNHSFGLTTMRDEHAQIKGPMICFEFLGKSGREHEIDLKDRRLARIVAQCQELPGQELFQFVDEKGEVRDIGSQDVNEYLREISGEDLTAKDFRTWAGTVLAAKVLQEFKEFDSQAAAKRNVMRAIEHVAGRLGNTKAVCRKCYIHPAVIDAYLEKSFIETVKEETERELREALKSLRPEEAAVLALLRKRMQRELRKAEGPKRSARARRPRPGSRSKTAKSRATSQVA